MNGYLVLDLKELTCIIVRDMGHPRELYIISVQTFPTISDSVIYSYSVGSQAISN